MLEENLKQGRAQLMADGDVLFEFVQMGKQVRVAAIDSASGTEIVIIAPVSASKSQMQQLALAKLRKKLSAAQP